MNQNILRHIDRHRVNEALRLYYDGTIDDDTLDALKLDAAEYVALFPLCPDNEKEAWADIDADLRAVSLMLDAELETIPAMPLPESLKRNLDAHISSLAAAESASEPASALPLKSRNRSRLSKFLYAASAAAAVIAVATIGVKLASLTDGNSFSIDRQAVEMSQQESSAGRNLHSENIPAEFKNDASESGIMGNPANARENLTASAAPARIKTYGTGTLEKKESKNARQLPKGSQTADTRREEAIRILEAAGYEISFSEESDNTKPDIQLANQLVSAVKPGMSAISASISDIDRNINDAEEIIDNNFNCIKTVMTFN